MRTLLSLVLPLLTAACAPAPQDTARPGSTASPRSIADRVLALVSAEGAMVDGYVSIDPADYPELVDALGGEDALLEGQSALVELVLNNDADKTVVGAPWSTVVVDGGRVDLPGHAVAGTLRLEAVFTQGAGALLAEARVVVPLTHPFRKDAPPIAKQIITEVKVLPIYIPEVGALPPPPSGDGSALPSGVLDVLDSLDEVRNGLATGGWSYAGYLELVRDPDGEIVQEAYHLVPGAAGDYFLPPVFVLAEGCRTDLGECLEALPTHASNDWVHLNGAGSAHGPGPVGDARWDLVRGSRQTTDVGKGFVATFAGSFELRSPGRGAPQVAGWYGAPTKDCVRFTSVTTPTCDTLTIDMHNSYLIFSLEENTPLLPLMTGEPKGTELTPDLVEDLNGASHQIGVDAPEIALTGEMLGGGVLYGSSPLQVEAIDPDGVCSLRVKVGGTLRLPDESGVVDLMPYTFAAGQHVMIEVAAEDCGGHRSTVTDDFYVDRMEPSVYISETMVSDGSGSWLLQALEIEDDLPWLRGRWSVVERGEGGAVAIRRTEISGEETFFLPTSSLSTGDYLVEVEVKDRGRHELNRGLGLVVDHQPSIVADPMPASASTVSGLTELSVAAEDDKGVVATNFWINGGLVEGSAGKVDWDSCMVKDGTVEAKVEVADISGQTAIRSWFFDVWNDQDEDGQRSCEGDCNDNDPTIFTGADETNGDGIDQDCDGVDLPRDAAELVDGDLLITEVMVDPVTGEDAYCEWVEILNNTEYLIDLAGIVLMDDDGAGDGEVVDSILLSPGDVAVLARGSAARFSEACPELDLAMTVDGFYGSGLAISNKGEYLRIDNSSGVAIDEVPALEYGLATAHLDASLYAAAPSPVSGTINDASSAWCASRSVLAYDENEAKLVDYGTPGTFDSDSCP